MKDAIIVDVDGTAALGIGKHRKPYEYNLCGKDYPNLNVWHLMGLWVRDNIEDHYIIFLSGRENVTFPGKSERKDKCYRKAEFGGFEYKNCYDLTYAWLKDLVIELLPNDYKNWTLFMRAADDNREDSIIKRDLFDKEIDNNYFVYWVLDDRDQVVAMWRNLGFTCFQVAPGNF